MPSSASAPLPSKADLRKAALERRKAVPQAVRDAFAEKLAVEGVQMARRAIVRNVAVFLPIGSEVDTRLLLAALDYHQFATLLPVTQARALMSVVFMRAYWSAIHAISRSPVPMSGAGTFWAGLIRSRLASS